MTKTISYINHNGHRVPRISGAKGKGGGKVTPNSLFATDILYLTNAIGEGPVYWINPNGPQDIQIQDNSIDDLINIRGNGLENTDKFFTISSTGTITQDPLPIFGDEIITAQSFASPVTLKKGNIDSIPPSQITLQETSANDWDAIRFSFIIEELYKATKSGSVKANTLKYSITIYDYLGVTELVTAVKTVTEKTDTAYKFSVKIEIPQQFRSTNGYRFSIAKLSDDSDDSKIRDTIKIVGWEEIKYKKQAYPRTAVIGYALKAVDEHTGGVPNFTSMVKGLLVKVPANYNQPILENGQIDWRQVEVSTSHRTTYGYRLQRPGTGTILYDSNPVIYTGTWDGSFVYSWTQNPVWIIYDLLTNTTYGLGIPEENVDKYRFYQIGLYCDACDATTGQFMGVSAIADGSYRYKPRTLYSSIRENQIGLVAGTPVSERRFLLDVTISDQEQTMDILNKLTATFRGMLIYSGGKISLAVDMPEEYPVMLFNEANIKKGSFQISGIKESDTYTGVDISYIEPTNHFKRETIRLDSADANDGSDILESENIASLDLTGVTRRSQAMRLGQYQIASSKYLRRNITFSTSTDAIHLAPGDVISVASQGTGIAYGFGGKIYANSAIADVSNTTVYLEHFTVPSITQQDIQNNTYPIALRILKTVDDSVDLYLVSNTSFILDDRYVYSGNDTINLNLLSKYNPITKTFVTLSSGLDAASAPVTGDLWTLGEVENPNNIYSNKSDKLFKITGITRDTNEQELIITAIEYVSNIYVDSDTFIDYEPISYVDITSPLSPPPPPTFKLSARPRSLLDGSVVIDGVIQETTEKAGYGQQFSTEYYVSFPEEIIPLTNVILSTTSEVSTANSGLYEGELSTVLLGKNGFESNIGEIRLLCNNYTLSGSDSIELSVEGLDHCIDYNFNTHVLAVNDGAIPTLKGVDYISIPVKEKTEAEGLLGFVGYQSQLTNITRAIDSYDAANNKIIVKNSLGGLDTLINSLPTPPFYISINQILAKNYYANNIFFVSGSSQNIQLEGNLISSATHYIDLPVKAKANSLIRFYADGILKSESSYTVNLNTNLDIPANIIYTSASDETVYRIESDYYTVPVFELNDFVDIGFNNTFVVVNSSYDSTSALYNATATYNGVFYLQLDKAPDIDLSGFKLINTTDNPVGVLLSDNTFQYNSDSYDSTINLANYYVYSLAVSSTYEKIFFGDELVIPELPVGITSVKARNRNVLGRTSPFVEHYIQVNSLPIQKVENIVIQESLYREQTGGVSVRVTCSFDHIQEQEVTDYEISYKLANIEDTGLDDAGSALTSYNTVKVPASGAENGKISFTINNVNRGLSAEATSIIIRITPMNKNIRGISAIVEKAIIGKTAKPLNVLNFTGGQQNELVTLFWQYQRNGSDLYDPDLKEVVIRRIAGSVEATLENYLLASPYLSASAPLERVTIPIDIYGSYTYLARTLDTSGNFSDSVVGAIISTSKPKRSTTVAAYSEDNPSIQFSSIPNNNASEYYFPSFANSTGGLANSTPNAVDAANGSSSGWSTSISSNDLLATSSAVYITQIRDFGQTVTGSVSIEASATQTIQATYNDQHEVVFELVSEASPAANVLVDLDGIGHLLGFNNALITSGRYDSNNKSWMTGPASGNVWAIWNPGQYIGDTANANSYALIAGLINANAIALGNTFYANGQPTGSNSLANLTSGASYYVVNMTQYSDTGVATYAGTLGTVYAQTFIRTSINSPYYANGNVNALVFTGSGDGFIPYEVGAKTFRYLQIKYEVTNNKPDEYDYLLDTLRYTIEKEQTIYTNTISYSSDPFVVDYTTASFLYRPAISIQVLDQKDAVANPAIAVITAASNTSVTFRLIASDGSGIYAANNTANVMITATGV